MEKNNKKLGYILMFITVIIWGLDNVLVKSLLTDISPNLLTYIRLLTTTFGVTILTSIGKRKYIKGTFDKKYLILIFGMGISLVIYYLLSINGLNLTKAVISEFLSTSLTTVFTILIMSIFIKEERQEFFDKYVIIALIVSLIGTYLTTVGDNNINIDFGAILIIISCVFWGMYMTMYKKINDSISVVRVSRDLDFVALSIYTLFLLLTQEFNQLFALDIMIIIKVSLVAILIDIGTILTYYVAIRIISGVKCSILSLLSPIIAFTLSFLWLKERITLMQLGGCILLFASSLVLIIKEYMEAKKDRINTLN